MVFSQLDKKGDSERELSPESQARFAQARWEEELLEKNNPDLLKNPLLNKLAVQGRTSKNENIMKLAADSFLFELTRLFKLPSQLNTAEFLDFGSFVLYCYVSNCGDSGNVRSNESVYVNFPEWQIDQYLKAGEIKYAEKTLQKRFSSFTLRQACRIKADRLNSFAIGRKNPTLYSRKIEREQRVILTDIERALCSPFHQQNRFIRENFPHLSSLLDKDYKQALRGQKEPP